MAVNVNLVTSRNQIPKYTYFLVRKNSPKIVSGLPLQEYYMYVFQNPVTSDRGTKALTDSYTQEVIPIRTDLFPIGSFTHFKYTNQKKEPLTLFYRDVEQIMVSVSASRTENMS